MSLSTDSPLGALYDRRVSHNQDLVIIVSDYHNRRGTGKTVLSLKLADALDRTDTGFTADKAVMSPGALTEAYTDHPEGSALVLDEAEAGLSKYQAGSATNRAIRELVSMGRVEEKYTIFNLPATAELDRDLKALCDVWVLVQRKGLALVHFLKHNPYQDTPLNEKVQQIEWSDLDPSGDLFQTYCQLSAQKKRRLDGDGEDDSMIRESEAEEIADRAHDGGRQERRDELLADLTEHTDLTTQQIADLPSIGISRSRVSQVVSDSNE